MFKPLHLRGRRGRLGLALLGLASFAVAAPPAIDFSERPEADATIASSDGTVTLSWAVPDQSGKVQLQQSATVAFAETDLRYEGRDSGSVLTGLPEGSHFFRIRFVDDSGAAGPWSAPVTADVVFMERGQLFLLLGLGGVVVIMTAGAILIGVTRPDPSKKIKPDPEVTV